MHSLDNKVFNVGNYLSFSLNSGGKQENLFRDDGLQEVPDLSRLLTGTQESII